MARPLVIVGTGNYWHSLVKPSLKALQEANIVSDVVSVDIKEDLISERHVVRQPGQLLSKIVDALGLNNPFVMLAHPNHLHAPEARELLENSTCEPSVIIEKPYANLLPGYHIHRWRQPL